MLKLNKKFKAKWLEKLRDKSYKQGVGYLRNSKDEFCCLGVACDIYDPNKWFKDEDGSNSLYNYVSFSGTLPPELRASIGLGVGDQFTLSNMNDMGKTFEEIADWIEVNL